MARILFVVACVVSMMTAQVAVGQDTGDGPLVRRYLRRPIRLQMPGDDGERAAQPLLAGVASSGMSDVPLGNAAGPLVNAEDRHARSGVTPPPGFFDWFELWSGAVSGERRNVHFTDYWGKAKWRGIPVSGNQEHRLGLFLTYGLIPDGRVQIPNDRVDFTLEKMGGGLNYSYTHFTEKRGVQWDIELGYALRVDELATKSGTWNGDQESDVVLGTIRFDYFRIGRKAIPRISTILTVEEDVHQELRKKTVTPGTKPEDRTYREFGMTLDLFDIGNGAIRPRLGAAMVAQPGSHQTRAAAIAGFSFWRDAVIVEGRYENGTGTDPDQKSVGVALDVYRLMRNIGGFFRGGSNPPAPSVPIDAAHPRQRGDPVAYGEVR